MEWPGPCDGKARVSSGAERCRRPAKWHRFALQRKQQGKVYTTTQKVGGKVMATTTHTVSADGNTIAEATQGVRPDGTSYSSTSTSQRVGSGTGLVGTWRETAVKLNAPSVLVMKLEGDKLHVEDANYKALSETKLDGTPAPLTGPTTPPGMTVSTTAEGSFKVMMSTMLNGKEMAKDEMTLSPDGRTITDVSWVPDKESEKLTYFYDKQ